MDEAYNMEIIALSDQQVKEISDELTANWGLVLIRKKSHLPFEGLYQIMQDNTNQKVVKSWYLIYDNQTGCYYQKV